MDESIDNLIIEHLKGLRSEVQTLRSEMHSEFRDVKHRLASVETTIVARSTKQRTFEATPCGNR